MSRTSLISCFIVFSCLLFQRITDRKFGRESDCNLAPVSRPKQKKTVISSPAVVSRGLVGGQMKLSLPYAGAVKTEIAASVSKTSADKLI